MKKLIVVAILLSSSSIFADWFCDNLDFSSVPVTFQHENQNFLKDFCETQLVKPFPCKVLNFQGEEFFVMQGYEELVLNYCREKALSENSSKRVKIEEKTFWDRAFEAMADMHSYGPLR